MTFRQRVEIFKICFKEQKRLSTTPYGDPEKLRYGTKNDAMVIKTALKEMGYKFITEYEKTHSSINGKYLSMDMITITGKDLKDDKCKDKD